MVLRYDNRMIYEGVTAADRNVGTRRISQYHVAIYHTRTLMKNGYEHMDEEDGHEYASHGDVMKNHYQYMAWWNY